MLFQVSKRIYGPYPERQLRLLSGAAAAAAVAPQQPQVFYEKFHFQNMSKKNSQSKEKLEKIKKYFKTGI